MNYNAVLAKKDGSYIPIRHDFDTHYGFVQDFMREQNESLRNGHLQIIVGDVIVDIDDISHIQPVYEDDEMEEQGGTKGMQLFGEGFMAEGDPYELAVFAKNLGADEIRMSDCCEDEGCCEECDCDEDETCLLSNKGLEIKDKATGQQLAKLDTNGNAQLTGCISTGIINSPLTWNGVVDFGDGNDHSAIVLQLPSRENFDERSSYLVKHIKSQYGNNIKVVVLPCDIQVIDTKL